MKKPILAEQTVLTKTNNTIDINHQQHPGVPNCLARNKAISIRGNRAISIPFSKQPASRPTSFLGRGGGGCAGKPANFPYHHQPSSLSLSLASSASLSFPFFFVPTIDLGLGIREQGASRHCSKHRTFFFSYIYPSIFAAFLSSRLLSVSQLVSHLVPAD